MTPQPAMLYRVDDVPRPFPRALGLGLQHVLTMFGATVAVPLLLGPAMGMTPAEVAVLVSAVMICSGLATFVQVRFGTRLPIIQGVSFSFLGPFFAIIAATGSGAEAMQYIAGAILAGAVIEGVAGYSTLFGRLRRFISPVVIGPVIALIGLALFQVGAPQAGRNWWLAGTVIACAFLFALVLAPRRRFFSLFPILLAVVVGYGLALVSTLAGVLRPGDAGAVEFAAVGAAPWLRDPATLLFPWGPPRFHLGFFLAVLTAYLASMIESFGDYFAIARAAGEPEPTARQVDRGIGAEGVGCFLTGLFGGFASTSYSENIGLVALTRVASRYVVYVAAALLVLLGMLAKFGAAVATIPAPVVGGLYCTLFGLITAVGIAIVSRADLTSQRNLLIIGFTLFMGLSVPAYFQGVPAFGYPPVQLDWPWAPWLADMVKTVGSTGMAVAAILGLLLDNLIPGTPEERG
ncbi:MAG TPA: uracil-xanthine permease family protein, partial [Thermoanaerobaculia bacterium]|nr:uracil-xanthine permease family protein [Thermoanaerobaculia bacterium]